MAHTRTFFFSWLARSVPEVLNQYIMHLSIAFLFFLSQQHQPKPAEPAHKGGPAERSVTLLVFSPLAHGTQSTETPAHTETAAAFASR